MWHKIKGVGEGFLGCMLMFGIFVIFGLVIGLFIKGGVWLSDKLYPWLVAISGLAIVVCLLVLLPLAIFRKTRGFAGSGIIIVSYVFGASLWTYSFLLAYVLWGVPGLVIGLFLVGIGVVPVAMLATIFNGMWAVFGELILMIVLTFGARFFGAFLAVKSEDDEETEIIDADYY